MHSITQVSVSKSMVNLIEIIRSKQGEIHQWLASYEGSKELPLYSSVDIRDAGFKMAVVDTNIFPAGFNNLCEHGIEDSVKFIRQAILRRVTDCKNILVIAEEHTRNVWYLENLRILELIIKEAGFNVKIATFLTVQPEFCENTHYVELQTALGLPIKIYCFKKILSDYEAGLEHFCLIIMNNDLTNGIPDILKNSKEPIYPSIQAGWHSRLKSHHFHHTQDLIEEFSKIINVDPWFFSSFYNVIDNIDINDENDRMKMMDKTSDVFRRIDKKYQEHHIEEKPFLFIKSDSGTYGMGVMSIEDPSDIRNLNRKNRNRLYKGKGSQIIQRYLIQEGIATMYSIDQEVSEVCIYQIENNLVGGFYRSHSSKSDRENLNSKGMVFKKMCPHLSKYGDCGVHHDVNVFDLYRILARIAGIAAHREIIHLEASQK